MRSIGAVQGMALVRHHQWRNVETARCCSALTAPSVLSIMSSDFSETVAFKEA